MNSKQGYVAVVLDEVSAAKLRRRAIHAEVHCHHVTMAYKPSEEQWNKYAHLLRTRIEFIATGIAQDERGQAALVKGVLSENQCTHVTLSCVAGTKPVYSNELLAQATKTKQKGIKRCRIKLAGIVRFIEF